MYSLIAKLFRWRRCNHNIKKGFKNMVITIRISFISLTTATRRYCGDGNKLFIGQLFASCKISQEGVCVVFYHPIHTNSTKKRIVNQDTIMTDRGKEVYVFTPRHDNATPMNQRIKRINLKQQQVTAEYYTC